MAQVKDTAILSPKGTFPATVAEVIDEYKIVINRGKLNNIEKGQEMLVYRLSDQEIKDPETGESLGYLELVIGTGKIIYVQDKMSIIESDKQKSISKTIERPFLGSYGRETLIEHEKIPFENPQVGDQVKPI